MDYSLADVVNLSGGKRRSVQLWAEAGAIRAFSVTEKRGTGTHRRFSREELIIACCLNALARRQVGIGELVRIGRGLRKFLKTPKGKREVEDAISGAVQSWEYCLFIIWKEDRDPEVLMPDEPEWTTELDAVRGHGLAIVLPLRECLARMEG